MGLFEREALNFVLQDTPEGIMISMFCFVFLNLHLRWDSIFIVAIVASFVNMIEVVPLGFGVHTLVLVLACMVILGILTKRTYQRSLWPYLLLFS